MDHTWFKCEQPCHNSYCQFCEGGLGLCTVCKAFEGSLTTECPGHVVTEEDQQLVYTSVLDFKDGHWYTKNTVQLIEEGWRTPQLISMTEKRKLCEARALELNKPLRERSEHNSRA